MRSSGSAAHYRVLRVIELLRLGLAEECEWGWTTTRPSGWGYVGRTEGRRRSAKNTCQFNWKSYSPPAVVESPILWYSTSSPVAPPPRRQSLATHNQPSAKHTIETMEWEAYINPLYYRYDGQWNSDAWLDRFHCVLQSLPSSNFHFRLNRYLPTIIPFNFAQQPLLLHLRFPSPILSVIACETMKLIIANRCIKRQ